MNLLKFIFISGLLFIGNITVFGDKHIFNILDYKAIPDGETITTEAIQNAIDDCSKTGGTVIIPAGKFVSGTLYLKSNVTLNLKKNATLLGSKNIDDYPHNTPEYKFYGHTWVKQSLIYAEKQINVSITGEGTIDGQGGAFQATTRKKPDRYRNRPYVLWFIECSNVKVEGVFLTNSAMWMQHYLACNKVWVQGIRVFNHCNKNNDMIDIDGCKYVIISNCIGDTDDDALTIKSTSSRASENIVVTNCILSSHCNAIKCGTESSGGFKNIVISNCVVRPSEQETTIYGAPKGISGITLGIVDGGTLDGININNIVIDGPRIPIYMRLGNRARPYRTNQGEIHVGSFKNVQISNIAATGADTTGCSITGIPGHPIENISLSNINITFKEGIFLNRNFSEVPELETHYPESTMFGTLPSSAFFIRHAKNVNLDQIQLQYQSKDIRPPINCDDVENLNLNNVLVGKNSHPDHLLELIYCNNVSVSGWTTNSATQALVKIIGENSNSIKVNNNQGTFKTEVVFGKDINNKALINR